MHSNSGLQQPRQSNHSIWRKKNKLPEQSRFTTGIQDDLVTNQLLHCDNDGSFGAGLVQF